MIELQDFYAEIEYGQFNDVDNYNTIRALNSSSIKFGEKTPLHVDKALDGKMKYAKKEFTFGSEFHYMLFEPEIFEKCFYFSDKHLGKKLNTDKALLLREKMFSGGKTRIDLVEGEKMKKMYESLHSHPGIRELIEKPGVIEQTLVWKDADFGINCKGRFDKLISNDFVIDLKTTKDACESYFAKDFKRYGYGIQAALYLDGYKTLYPEHTSIEFVFIAIDKEEPFYCELYEISEKTMNEGKSKYKKYIREYIEYKNNPVSIYSSKLL